MTMVRALLLALALAGLAPAGAAAQVTVASAVTEFDVNGLKVLVKRRASSQTVVAGLFLKGGVRNVASQNAGIESLMLDVASEASAAYPRARMRRELARTGSSLSFASARDYSAITLASPKRHFDAGWTLFADATLRPAFSADDFERVRSLHLNALLNMEDTPDAYIGVLQSRAAFAGHPYANDPDGTTASVKALTAASRSR